MASLHILTEGFPQKIFELQLGVNTIGRAEDNSIHIPDTSVSSYHGQITVTDEQMVFKDLDSTNGSFMNDAAIAEVLLPPGVQFRLGSVEMQISPPEPDDSDGKKGTTKIQVVPTGGESVGDAVAVAGQSPFKKKSSRGNLIFLVIGITIGLVTCVLVFLMWQKLSTDNDADPGKDQGKIGEFKLDG